MAKSQITRYFNSPYLHVADDGEFFLFPSGTDRNEIIDTLENYFEFRGWNRVQRYETIGEVLTNTFIQVSDTPLGTGIYTDVCTDPIEVYL